MFVNLLKIIDYRILIPVIFILNLNFPINNLFSLTIFSLTIILTFNSKLRNNNLLIPFLVIILITFTNLFILKKPNIHEAHSVFMFENDIKILEKFIPKRMTDDIRNDLQNYDYERYLKAKLLKHSKEHVDYLMEHEKIISNYFSFSSDSIIQKNKYSRITNNINFKKRSDYRIGSFNELIFHVPFDQDLKENMPFYVFYEIPSILKNSKFCSKGKVYFLSTNSNYNNNLEFNKKKQDQDCILLNEKYENHFIFAYSINEKDNLEVKLIKNNKYKIFEYLNIALILFLLIYLFTNILEIKNIRNIYILFFSFIFTFLFAYISDADTITGLRHLYAGADGLVFNDSAINILRNLVNLNFEQAFWGGRDVYYFQPGLRYFIAIFKFIFGETNYGYFFLTSFLPFVIYLLIKKITNEKIALYLFIFFVFIPIFEKIGFAQFNYVRQAVRFHAETAGILFIFIAIFLLFDLKITNEKNSVYKIIFIGLTLGFATFFRPNFFPTCILLTFFLFYRFYINSNYKYYIIYILSFSPFFFAFIHNLYFSDRLVFFTDGTIHLAYNLGIYEGYNNIIEIAIKQLYAWNKPIYFPRLIVFIYVLFNVFKYKKDNLLFILTLCCIGQHMLMLISHPGSRYAYLAWLLTFILFIKMAYDNNLFNKKIFKLLNFNFFKK